MTEPLVYKFWNVKPFDSGECMEFHMAEECEKIADDYAIEFAEWLFDVSRIGTTKELLEIFKKEKGL
jgi:hypothetical protein